MSKTIHLITGLNVGGAETFLYNYLRALPPDVAADHVVVSMTGAGVYGSQLLDAGVSVVCLNFSLSGSAFLSLLLNCFAWHLGVTTELPFFGCIIQCCCHLFFADLQKRLFGWFADRLMVWSVLNGPLA